MTEMLHRDSSLFDDQYSRSVKRKPSSKIHQKNHYSFQLKGVTYQVQLDSPRTRQALHDAGLAEEIFRELNEQLMEIASDKELSHEVKQMRLEHCNKRLLRIIETLNKHRERYMQKEDGRNQKQRIHADGSQFITNPMSPLQNINVSSKVLRTEQTPENNYQRNKIKKITGSWLQMSQNMHPRDLRSLSYDRGSSILALRKGKFNLVPKELVHDYTRAINSLKKNKNTPNLLATSEIFTSNNNNNYATTPHTQQITGSNGNLSHQEDSINNFQTEPSTELEKQIEQFNRFKRIAQHKALQEYSQEMRRKMLENQEHMRLKKRMEQDAIEKRKQLLKEEKRKERNKNIMYEKEEEEENKKKQREESIEKVRKKLEKKREIIRQEEELRERQRILKSQQRRRRLEQQQENRLHIQEQENRRIEEQKQIIELRLQQCGEVTLHNNLKKQLRLREQFEKSKEVLYAVKESQKLSEAMRLNEAVDRLEKNEKERKKKERERIKKEMLLKEELERKNDRRLEQDSSIQNKESDSPDTLERKMQKYEQFVKQKQMEHLEMWQLKNEQQRLKELEIKENEQLKKRELDAKYENLISKYRKMDEWKEQQMQKKELVRRARVESAILLHQENERIFHNMEKVTHGLAGEGLQFVKDKNFEKKQQKILHSIVPEQDIELATQQSITKTPISAMGILSKSKDKMSQLANVSRQQQGQTDGGNQEVSSHILSDRSLTNSNKKFTAQ